MARGPRVWITSWMAVSRTCRSMPSRRCSTSTTLPPCSATRSSSRASPPGRSGTVVASTIRRPAAVSPMRMHSASSEASTLPPESTAQVVAVGRRLHPPVQQRRDAHRARALHHELRPLQQQHHRLGHLVVGHGHDLVHVALDQRRRHRAGLLHGDAVADRVGQVLGSARPPPARPGTAIAMPEISPPPPERHHDQPHVRRLARDLQAHGALARHDRRMVEGRDQHAGPPPRPPRAAALDRVLEAALHQPHLAAVLAHGRHLRHRRALGHHEHGVAARRRAANATACAWLPALAATTRARFARHAR